MEKTYRIHYFGKGKKVLNEWENFTAKDSSEAKIKAMKLAKKVKEIHGLEQLQVDVHELTFVTFFELE